MIRVWDWLSTAAGLLTLAVGIGLRHWLHGGVADIASGFLLGVSIALLILGLARRSRQISR